MTTPNILDIILIRDGDNLIMQTNSAYVKVRLAYVETASGAEKTGEVKITPLIQGSNDESEYSQFLDGITSQVKNYIESGALDSERENIRLRNLLAEATAKAA